MSDNGRPGNPTMTLDEIRLFILAARHRSITRAGREFHITQPAASRQLKLLQEDLRTTLLKRNGRGVELTGSGEDFLRHVVPILSQLDGLRKRYTSSRESLTIAGSHGLAEFLLPSIVTQFSKSYPSIKLTWLAGASQKIEQLLAAATVDLAVLTNPTMSPSFHMERYRSEELIAFVAARHPLAEKNLRAAELYRIPLVIRVGRDGQTTTEEQLDRFQKTGQELNIVMRCGSPDLVKEAVRHGAGVGILYRDLVKRDIERGDFKVLKLPGIDLNGLSYIVYLKHKPLSALAEEFLALLRAEVKGKGPLETRLPLTEPRGSVRRASTACPKLFRSAQDEPRRRVPRKRRSRVSNAQV